MAGPKESRTFTISDIAPGSRGVAQLHAHLHDVLNGGQPVALVPAYAAPAIRRQLHRRLVAAAGGLAKFDHDDAALIVPTSGSTGSPALVVLDRQALRAAVTARDAATGGPSGWLVALPAVTAGTVIAAAKATLAGTGLGSWSGVGGAARFDPAQVAAELHTFADRAEAAGQLARAAMVATQLARLSTNGHATQALARYERVLIGGGPVAPTVLARAAAAGVTVTTTYGMTETCGGCVYDGLATASVSVALSSSGEILLTGPCLAAGYLDADMPRTAAGLYRTGDRGAFDESGALVVAGRMDSVVTVGGANVDLDAVGRLLATMPGVDDHAVLTKVAASGGHQIVAYIVGTASPATVRARIADELGHAAVPEVTISATLPRLPGGKVDLQRLRRGWR